jgi:hypothetical protein
MNVVDDFSSYPWSIPLKRKSDAFHALQTWERAREVETGLKVGTYRTDNGELKSHEMQKWLESRGTTHEFTAPHTSAHIGRVERMHRTLMGKARTMRIYASLPPQFWEEFYLTAAHVHAKTTSQSLQGKTPWELWHGKLPDLSYLREAGCRAFVLIVNKHNPKIYERSIECILLGYEPGMKAYRCYDQKTNQVYISYHVRFLESHDGHSRPPPSTHSPSQPILEIPHTFLQPLPDESDDNDASGPIAPVTEASGPIAPVTDARRSITDGLSTSLPSPEASGPIAPVADARRSTRIAARVPDRPSRLATAVQASIDSAARVRAHKEQRRLDLLRLHTDVVPPPISDSELTHLSDDIRHPGGSCDDALMALSDLSSSNISVPYEVDPHTWEEARNSSQGAAWHVSYQEELQSLKDMGVYELIPPTEVPSGTKIHTGKPVFHVKRDELGEVTRRKTRLVFKGFEQVYGRDYHKTTSPTARMESWRLLLHIAAHFGWDAQQLDVKTAFLYGLLPDDEIQFMYQPKGFEEPGRELWVWKIVRGLYGMKQAGRIWNKTMHDKMIGWGFTQLSSESCVYHRETPLGIVIAAVHVDDFLSIASTKAENVRFKDQMKEVWTISDLGEVRFVVGIAVEWDRPNHTVKLSQTALIDRIVLQFGQADSAPLSYPMVPGLKLRRIIRSSLPTDDQHHLSKLPYRSLIGSLLYLAISTRPDISYAIQQLSQFLDCYSYEHWAAAIRVVRYLKGTRSLRLHLGGNRTLDLVGYSDSDWANCPDTRRSVGGFAFSLGSGVISWSVRKQKTVAASSCEAEYVAAFAAAKENSWLRSVFLGIKLPFKNTTIIHCDNNAAICLSEDPLLHDRVKHIDIKYHFIRERAESKELKLKYINTKDNLADIFTKALEGPQYIRLRGFLGLQ